MNPLSPLTYYLRHKRSALLQIALISLATVGLFILVGVLDAIPLRVNVSYLTKLSRVIPTGDALDPAVVSQIQTHPDVARTIPDNGLPIAPPTLIGTDPQRLLGVSPEDAHYLMQHCGVRLKEGRMFEPRTNEIVLSAAVAANRDLHVGDVIGGAIEDDDTLADDDLPTEMVVVGILSPDHPWVGFASYEYLNSHELTLSRGPRLLVISHEGRKPTLDNWLEESMDSTQTRVITHGIKEHEYREMTTSMVLTFAVLECMIAAVAVIALATLNYVFFTQRKEEFGILNAIGRNRLWLLLRTMKETGSVVSVAWVVGAALCGIGLICMQALLYAPRGLNLDFFSLAPWLFTLPIPLTVVAASVGTIGWMLSRLDPVSIIERR